MAIENFNEVQEYFNTNKDSEDVKNFLNGFTTIDVFKEKVNSDSNFKSFMDSEKDKHYSKALETWKQNNLQKMIDDKVKELYPKDDPKDLELKKLQQQIDKMNKDSLHEKLTNKALKVATEKKLPTDLIDFIIGDSEETTNANLEKLASIFAAHDETIRKEFVSGNSYTPPNNKNDNLSGDDKILEQIRKGMGTNKTQK